MASSKPQRAKTKPAHSAKKPKKSSAAVAKKRAKKPVAKTQARKAPATKKPVAKKAVAKKPVAKKAVAKKAVAKKAVAKKAVAKKAVAKKSLRATLARDALSTLAQKRAIRATLEPATAGQEVVDAYMRDVDHPFKAELEAVRQIILGASPKLSERIKWNAPSFYYKEDLGAFNPRAMQYAHLILLFPGGAGMEDDTLLEGKHKDRREVKFHSMADVAAKKPALEKLVKRWVALRDR